MSSLFNLGLLFQQEQVKPVKKYIPGEFYRRELPCILKVHNKVKEDINLIIVDSYVFLGNGKMGLGAYLFKALDSKIPIIGVAKTFFKDCPDCIKIYRGQSSKPLYISSIGIELKESAKFIKNLGGNNRTPDMLRKADQLTRRDHKV